MDTIITTSGGAMKQRSGLALVLASIVATTFGTSRLAAQDVVPATAELGPDYVRIPGAFAHRECVHEIPEGATLIQDKSGYAIRDSKKNEVARYGRCRYPIYKFEDTGEGRPWAQPRQGSSQQENLAPPPTVDGWVERSNISLAGTNRTFTETEASWIVPPEPATKTSQLIYMFNSLSNDCAIIQPVLQWGNGFQGAGGNYWAMANWLVDWGPNTCFNQVFHDALTPVSAGALIKGRINSYGCDEEGCLQWHISYRVNSGSTKTMTLGPMVYSWIYADRAALEVYNLTSCSQLPGSIGDFFGTRAWRRTTNPNARFEVTNWSNLVTPGLSPWCNYNVINASDANHVLLMWNM